MEITSKPYLSLYNADLIKDPINYYDNMSPDEIEDLKFSRKRDKVLYRDNHTCQYCKAKNKPLSVHHIKAVLKGGSNSADNLITLCTDCHDKYHKGFIDKDHFSNHFRKHQEMSNVAFMNRVPKLITRKLESKYGNVSVTYSYAIKCTKSNYLRINPTRYNKPGDNFRFHGICLTGNLEAEKATEYFEMMKTKCHNRRVYRNNLSKGGRLVRINVPYLGGHASNLRLYDKVKCEGKEYFVVGRTSNRNEVLLKTLDEVITKSATKKSRVYYKLKFLETRHSIVVQRLSS